MKRQYTKRTEFKGKSRELSLSKKSIGNNKTYELYFKTEKNSECMEFSIESEYYPTKFKRKKVKNEVYFIVEKRIDITQFNDKKKYVYTIIGKNFTSSWEQNRSVEICPGRKNIMLALKPFSVFRVRMTSFIPENFYYSLTINADSKITKITE